MRSKDRLLAASLTALFGSLNPASHVAAQSAPAPAPVADHHTHINSIAAARLDAAPLPTVAIPAGLDSLLREYERLLNARDAVGLSRLFTEDGMVLNIQNHIWMRGQIGVQFLYSGASGGYRYRPTAFSRSDSLAHITGGLAVGPADTPRDIGHFIMVVRQHSSGLWRVAAEMVHVGGPTAAKAYTAEDLIRKLDSTGVRRAAVMSVAYWFDSPAYDLANRSELVAAENDWVAAQVARYPDRLLGFCSAGPLRPWAVAEIERCARHPQMRGVKIHVTNGGFDFANASNVAALRAVFATANRLRLPILIHMRTSGRTYGRAEAETFVREVLPAAADVPVQIAHMGGWGAYEAAVDSALGAFIGAIAARAPGTSQLFFELSGAASTRSSAAMRARLAERIRQLGIPRILFGSDNVASEWADFQRLVPLTHGEFTAIAQNVAPFLSVLPMSPRR